MFDNVALNVVIGLVFIFLLYSLLATIIQEILAAKLAFRAKILERGILRMLEDGKSPSWFAGTVQLVFTRNMLKDKKVAAWFFAHPLVKYLGENNHHSKPSYLSAQNFSKVMIDLLKGFGDRTESEVQRINDSVRRGVIYHLPVDITSDSKNPAIAALRYQLGKSFQSGKGDPLNVSELNPDTRLFLRSIWEESGADIDAFRLKLEKWFDDTMERTTGWYKKHTQNVLLVIGLGLAAAFNVDSICIAKKLMKDPALQERIVAAAGQFLEKNKELGAQLSAAKTGGDSAVIAKLKAEQDVASRRSGELLDSAKNMINNDIKNVNDLMGMGGWTWQGYHPHFSLQKDQYWSTCFVGWLLTALAISLGAPFWYDLLNKLMKLRTSGNKIEAGAGAVPSGDASGVSPSVAVNVHTQTGEEAVG